MQNLNVTIIQSDLKWEDPATNLANFQEAIHSITESTDVIVLPEMFNTGFSMNPELLAEEFEGKTISWMREMAASKNAVICGSLIFDEAISFVEKHYVNKFVWVTPDGQIESYDKHHLFSLVHEDWLFDKGNEHVIINYKGWKIQPFICYDLRFPVWCRNVYDADLQIFVANWPEKRSDHWKTLLKARAIENQCYVVGVNRIGNDNNEVYHSGDSGIYNFAGETLISVKDNFTIHTETLSLSELKSYRKRYPFLNDKDEFTIG